MQLERQILLILEIFFSAIGLYNSDFTTAVNPESNKAIYDKNCPIDAIKPLTLEP